MLSNYRLKSRNPEPPNVSVFDCLPYFAADFERLQLGYRARPVCDRNCLISEL